MNPTTPSVREIVESPIEIGQDEIIPFRLTVPVSWGNASNPSIEPAHMISEGPTMQGARKILFTLNARDCLVGGDDCRVEIKFEIPGGIMEAWGIWQCKE